MRRNMSFRFSAQAAAAVILAATSAVSGWSQGDPAQDKSIPTSKVERLNRAPVSKEVLKVKLPRPIETVLPNGINLMILEDHRFPLVTVQFDVNGAGPMYEPAGQPGLAGATARLLTEGTKSRTSKQIAEQIDSMGASLSASAPAPPWWLHRDCRTRSNNGSDLPRTFCCIRIFPPRSWRNTRRAPSPRCCSSARSQDFWPIKR